MLAEMLDTLQKPASEQGRSTKDEASRLSDGQHELLAEIEHRDNIFAEIDPQVYGSRSAG
jgi:hypothetical protein